jgi:DNA mismatch endonuclease (patch repair protein)
MSQIKGKNTKPEILVRKFLFGKGYRFRIHSTGLPGKPDIVLTKYKIVIFVNGCFWHGHEGCKYFVIPKTRTDWWTAKIYKNRERDSENYDKLVQNGWRIIRIFECDLKKDKIEKTLNELIANIH